VVVAVAVLMVVMVVVSHAQASGNRPLSSPSPAIARSAAA
jgi:hypothetical protein